MTVVDTAAPVLTAEDQFEWETSTAQIKAASGDIVFQQEGVEFPVGWSPTARAIVAQKYFNVLPDGTREYSLRQLVGRVTDRLREGGLKQGHFATEQEADEFIFKLKTLLYSQALSFNTPVWFNIGVPGRRQQASACFILSVDDSMESIEQWLQDEMNIFRGGSGAGVNVSKLRSSLEMLRGQVVATGPLGFIRIADSAAGVIKSGGAARKAAKMVVMDIDHPDVIDFIWSKAAEEAKARDLAALGYDVGIDGSDAYNVQYQNANISVRLTDAFMQAVQDDANWDLRAPSDGRVLGRCRAQWLFEQIASAAHACADPGVQFTDTINSWHTNPSAGAINASNPCSEYMHLDDTACNLASLNLVKFIDVPNRSVNYSVLMDAARIAIRAQDILVDISEYPTDRIAQRVHDYRELGLGFANAGGLLMRLGIPYDSEEGRHLVGSCAAAICAAAWDESSCMAQQIGPMQGYAPDADVVQAVLRRHAMHIATLGMPATTAVMDQACKRAAEWGVRNSQVTVIAPTGTIGLMMDVDTTGIEPELALTKTKVLVGGGTLTMVSDAVRDALAALGYDQDAQEAIADHIVANGTPHGAPGLDPQHVAVFATSLGDPAIEPMGHLRMMAAVQPFVSGAISKTINLPQSATVKDIANIYQQAWRMGIKAVSIYRDGCKVDQPVRAQVSKEQPKEPSAPVPSASPAARRRLPRSRHSHTHAFSVGGLEGYITVGLYDDGRPGELFIKASKQGSTISGLLDAVAMACSIGLQYGVPLEVYLDKFIGQKFDPAGITDDPDIRFASSPLDYIFKKLQQEYVERRSSLSARDGVPVPGDTGEASDHLGAADLAKHIPLQVHANGNGRVHHGGICSACGNPTMVSGTCQVCTVCGQTTGCS